MSENAPQLFQCASCGNIGLGQGAITCCSTSMEPIEAADSVVGHPSLDDLLGTVFEMSDTELDICLCVMESGEQTVKELAEETSYERSVVSRHLNHLVELGVLNKHRRLLEKGGHVYVYSPKHPEIVRDNFRKSFLRWIQQASSCIDALSREKVETILEADSFDSQWRIYQK